MLVADLDIRVIDAATGELLRHLTLDPPATTSPSAAHPAHHPENRNNPTPNEGSGCPGCPETSQAPREDSNLRPAVRKPLTGVSSDLLRSRLTCSALVLVSLSHLWYYRLPCLGWAIGWATSGRLPGCWASGRHPHRPATSLAAPRTWGRRRAGPLHCTTAFSRPIICGAGASLPGHARSASQSERNCRELGDIIEPENRTAGSRVGWSCPVEPGPLLAPPATVGSVPLMASRSRTRPGTGSPDGGCRYRAQQVAATHQISAVMDG